MARKRTPPRKANGQFRKRKDGKRKVRRNLAGFMVGSKFHPIRGSSGYSESLADDAPHGSKGLGRLKRRRKAAGLK